MDVLFHLSGRGNFQLAEEDREEQAEPIKRRNVYRNVGVFHLCERRKSTYRKRTVSGRTTWGLPALRGNAAHQCMGDRIARVGRKAT